ncbi:MAG: hypothetical protein M1838_001233 [Thelocarpon superellum]|nr:MAG: hypothetical protein M1838_001233 [Thelocarpon superellum]
MGNSQGKPVVFTDEVNLNHFRLLRVVGKGAFGKVRIVERKDTGLTFALKYIRKDEVVRSESVRNIIRERRMLEHLNHPFLCNLRYSFQDIEYLYIVVDLMNGGDLRFHISRKAFTEDTVRFWIAELGCALRYIHKQGIVHRDVKPDNVLLDEGGHVHLADFNVASDFTPGKPLTSKSGTLAYLAPEVYAGRGYTSDVDWWSLGVLFFECIYNKRPFKGHSHDKLAKEIMEAPIHFPNTQPPVTPLCLQAMGALLERDVRKRIGTRDFSTFTSHPFFAVLDFEALENKQIEPIFIPSSEKTNFDATYDLEELLLEEAPLEARARRQRPREQLKEDATDKEIRADELHRMIESLFEPFDYTAVTYTNPIVSTEAHNSSGSPPDWARPTSTSKSSTEDSGSPGIAIDSPTRVPIPKSTNGSPPPALKDGREGGDAAASRTTTQDSQQRSVSATAGAPRAVTRLREKTNRGNRSISLGGAGQGGMGENKPGVDLADPSSTIPTEGKPEAKGKPSMLGFLTRKHGRGASPRPQERGVLGREGARHIVN